MRRILFILLVLIGITCHAQNGSTPIIEDSVFQYSGRSADELYSQLKLFVARSFKTSKVIQMDDPTSHRLVVKGNIDFPVNNLTWHELTGVINFSMELQAKDGRFRVKLYGFEHESFNRQYKSWTMGPIYVEESPSCIKWLLKKQYKAMHTRAMPKILDTIAMTYALLGNLYIQEQESEEW